MLEFLYNIIIFPIVQIIEITFTIVNNILQNKVIAIVGVSAVVTLCTLPLYFIAEKWQHAERELQKKLKPKVDKIKSVFKGDEQYMILSTYYRQNHYHPLFALRNSFSILIQVPFFIAAYSYLSHLDSIKGISFFFIKDLGAPDQFMSLGGFSLNILPVIMTLINCISGAVYTKGLLAKDKIQVYGMALIFLVLLYNSPAGLVLYWTMNNLFSLAKNVLSKIKHWKQIVYAALCLCALFVIVRYLRLGLSPNRLLISIFCSLIFFTPLFIKLFKFVTNKISQIIIVEQSSIAKNSVYILSALILLVLCGLVIPGSLIASDVQEFSFRESYTTPLPFLGTVFVQAMGIFIFWPLCIYFLFSKNIKYGLTLILSLLCVAALVNTFFFPLDYGIITATLRFSNPDLVINPSSIINALVLLGILGIFSYLLLCKRRFIFHSFQLIVLAALLCFSVINIYNINKDFKHYEQLLAETSSGQIGDLEPIYHFSKHGKNVVVFMLDAAVSGYVPYIFDEKPELLNNFIGFTYFPNCTSFGHHTRVGVPPLFGSYEYKPENIQKNRSIAREKHNEALLMMPRIFSKENYRVTVTDPSLANYSPKPDLSIFTPYPDITALNIKGNYSSKWLQSHPELKLVSIPELLKVTLIRFSFLKISPPAGRILIYDKARWLKPGGNFHGNQFSLDVIDNYTSMDYLPLLTEVSDNDTNTYTAIVNDLPHDPALFRYPDYVPAMNITNIGDGSLQGDALYHPNIASFLLVGKWLQFLQDQGVYDNTRIIIASDHGKGTGNNYQGNIRLPNGHGLSQYHALLLVKDFNNRGDLATDMQFMTLGDVPLIVMKDLIDTPKNPFSGNVIQSDKEDGIFTLTTSPLQYTYTDEQWMHVRDNIFDAANWEKVKK